MKASLEYSLAPWAAWDVITFTFRKKLTPLFEFVNIGWQDLGGWEIGVQNREEGVEWKLQRSRLTTEDGR
jgi:hypothetical protein